MLNWYSLQKPIPPPTTELHPVSPNPLNFSGYAPDIACLTVTSTVSASIQPAIVNNAKFPKQVPTFFSLVQPTILNASNLSGPRNLLT